MGFLSAKDEAAVRKEFERIGGPVKLTVFASELGGEHNGQTVALIQEVAALVRPALGGRAEPAHRAGPGRGLRDRASRRPSWWKAPRTTAFAFSACRAGYEFSNLIDSIIAVSTGEAGLSEETKTALAGLTEDVTIKVFATPT